MEIRNRGCGGGERYFLDCDLSASADCLHTDDAGIEYI